MHAAGGNVENSMGVPQKLNTELPYDPTMHTQRKWKQGLPEALDPMFRAPLSPRTKGWRHPVFFDS